MSGQVQGTGDQGPGAAEELFLLALTRGDVDDLRNVVCLACESPDGEYRLTDDARARVESLDARLEELLGS